MIGSAASLGWALLGALTRALLSPRGRRGTASVQRLAREWLRAASSRGLANFPEPPSFPQLEDARAKRKSVTSGGRGGSPFSCAQSALRNVRHGNEPDFTAAASWPALRNVRHGNESEVRRCRELASSAHLRAGGKVGVP